MGYGFINKITSSVLIGFIDKKTNEKQVYDIGLNLKNKTKKVHIPHYVRYVERLPVVNMEEHEYQIQKYGYSNFKVRKVFEYSKECV